MTPLKNSAEHYGLIAKTFHWVMALAVVVMLAVGLYMEDLPPSPDKFRIYGIHKSIGALILIAAFLRLGWRFLNVAPPLPDSLPRWQKLAAHGMHAALYLLLLLMPLSGWLMSSAAGFPVSVFGWFTLPSLVSPDKKLFDALVKTHGLLANVLMAAGAAHILAALKHHFIDKDNILRRMLPLFLLPLFWQPASAAEEVLARQWYVDRDQSSLTFTAKQNDAPVKGTFGRYWINITFSPQDL